MRSVGRSHRLTPNKPTKNGPCGRFFSSVVLPPTTQPNKHPTHSIAAHYAGNGEDGRYLQILTPRHWHAVGWQHHGSDAQRHHETYGDAGERFQQDCGGGIVHACDVPEPL